MTNRLDRAAQLDNIIFTNYPIRRRADVEKALDGSGVIVDPSCRIRYLDRGLLAVFRAGDDGGEMAQWMAINWAILNETDRNTWLMHWARLPRMNTQEGGAS